MDISSVVNKIFYYYENYGSRDYIGEPVTQIEHMVQGAMFAEQDNLGQEIVLAVFLHDIGHLLLDNNNEKMGDLGIMRHETKGRLFLESLGILKPIPELVENHVKAKRYLVTKNPEYYKNLSKASKETLEYQGGRMTVDEIREFELDDLFYNSLLVRKYDEMSKRTDIPINELSYYRKYLTNYLTNYLLHKQK